MKPRHVAALALVGWYLMTPPINNRTGKYDSTAPLSTGLWFTIASFDTADRCEDIRSKMADGYKKTHDSSGLDRMVNSTCIASNDLRLKPN